MIGIALSLFFMFSSVLVIALAYSKYNYNKMVNNHGAVFANNMRKKQKIFGAGLLIVSIANFCLNVVSY